MGRSPLPPEVTRAVRAYLEALLPPGDVVDALHEVQDDAAYWGERDLVAVMRMACAVVAGRQRVSEEVVVATLAETGLDAAQIAAVLGRRPVEVPAGAPPTSAEEPTSEPSPSPPSAAEPPAPAAAEDPTEPQDGPEPVRIGFDEDDAPLPTFHAQEPRGGVGRIVLITLLAVWVVLAIVWLLRS